MSSYVLAHRRMTPLLEAARAFDIGSNLHPAALFDARSACVNIWCTPDDHPGGLWAQVEMIAGAFSKPCAFVASAYWEWSEGEHPTIVGIRLVTDAYELQRDDLLKVSEIRNRPEDLAWAEQKLTWLWQASRAEGPMPPVVVGEG